MTPTRRLTAALVGLCAAASLSACASGSLTRGTGAVGSGAPTGSGSSAAPSGGTSSSGAHGADLETLAAQLHQGVSTVRTAHLELQIGVAGESLTGSGDEQLDGGKLRALRLTENLPSGAGSLSLVLTGGKTYLKLPAGLNKSTKPWVLARPDSANPIVRQLSQSLSTSLSSASLSSVGAFIDAAKSVRTVGRESIAGTTTTHLHIVVDTAKLAKTVPGGDTLRTIGAELPVEMWLDDQHRPVQITEDFTVNGQRASTKVTTSRFNQPVSIAAPPAGEVDTS